MVYLVTWDLNGEKPDYPAARARFIQKVNKYDNTSDPGLDSVRFISTSLTANQLCDDLRTALDDSDRIVVTKMVSGNHQGWLSKEVWDWINQRI